VSRASDVLRGRDRERDFDRELDAHLAMATDDKIRQGLTPTEAHRAARVELGGVAQVREAGRAARGLPWLEACGLDVRLGLRRLRKHWGLTVVGGLAMTVVIAVGTAFHTYLSTFLAGSVPLDEGDRIVALVTGDTLRTRALGISLDDLDRWQGALRSVEDVGAFRTAERNLVVPSAASEVVAVAEMSASGFALARVPPLLGRPLVAADERPDAAPAVVVGEDVWRSRFGSAPGIVGQPVELDGVAHTVVGVMPEGFGFPVSYRFWTALRAMPADARGLDVVFARRATGATLETVGAELGAVGLLPDDAFPADVPVRPIAPRAIAYSAAFVSDADFALFGWLRLFVVLLLVPPAVNIAILIYARTVTRQEEVAVRTALGASRRRIVVQLFIEVLALAAGAAGAAVAVIYAVMLWVQGGAAPEMSPLPFWIEFRASLSMVAYAAGLALLAAVIAGLVPALYATARFTASGLQALGGRATVRLGPAWTVLIVAQVAFSFAALPGASEMAWGIVRPYVLGPGLPAGEMLTARLAIDQGSGATDRYAELQAQLIDRLEAEPGVRSAVAVASGVPGSGTVPVAEIAVEPLGGAAAPGDGFVNTLVRVLRVDQRFFEVLDASRVAGRVFGPGDFGGAITGIVVDETFVRTVLEGEPPLGRRVRVLREFGSGMPPLQADAGYEILGVVSDRPTHQTQGTIYLAEARERMHPASLLRRVGDTSGRTAGRVADLARSLVSSLRADPVRTLDQVYDPMARGAYLVSALLVVSTLSVLLLSAAGLYALVTFTVNQRRREIGIRSALGASPRRLLSGVLGRALAQVAAGATAGVAVATLIDTLIPMQVLGGWEVPGILPGAAAFVMLVGALAVAGPARRALRVQPVDVLHDG
jgi:predicted permease